MAEDDEGGTVADEGEGGAVTEGWEEDVEPAAADEEGIETAALDEEDVELAALDEKEKAVEPTASDEEDVEPAESDEEGGNPTAAEERDTKAPADGTEGGAAAATGKGCDSLEDWDAAGLVEEIAGANLAEEPLGRRHALQSKESAGLSRVQVAQSQEECEGGSPFFLHSRSRCSRGG